MATSAICADRELDYFVLQDLPEGGECFVVFHRDGTFQMNMFTKIGGGEWSDSALTVAQGGETASFAYRLDGDLLTIDLGEEMTFCRSDDPPPSLSAESDGGQVFQASFAGGTISAVCPEGWYTYKNGLQDGILLFTQTPDPFDPDHGSIKFMGYEKLINSHHASHGGDPILIKAAGREWRGTNDEGTELTVSVVIGSWIVEVYARGVLSDGDILQGAIHSFTTDISA